MVVHIGHRTTFTAPGIPAWRRRGRESEGGPRWIKNGPLSSSENRTEKQTNRI